MKLVLPVFSQYPNITKRRKKPDQYKQNLSSKNPNAKIFFFFFVSPSLRSYNIFILFIYFSPLSLSLFNVCLSLRICLFGVKIGWIENWGQKMTDECVWLEGERGEKIGGAQKFSFQAHKNSILLKGGKLKWK